LQLTGFWFDGLLVYGSIKILDSSSREVLIFWAFSFCFCCFVAEGFLVYQYPASFGVLLAHTRRNKFVDSKNKRSCGFQSGNVL